MLSYDDVVLYVGADKFFLVSENRNPRQALVIDRVSHVISVEDGVNELLQTLNRRPLGAVLGCITLLAGPYLVIAQKKTKIGDLSTSNDGVFQLSDPELIPFARTDLHLTVSQQQENRAFVTMLHQVLATPGFFASHCTDLTRPLQRKYEDQVGPRSHADVWDARFVWNQVLLEKFISLGPHALLYCCAIIQGAVFIRQCYVNGYRFRYTVISRRSTRHAGTRFFARGIDEHGSCANFVETEQMVEHADTMSSFVQTRGSLPVFWTQTPDVIHRKPDPKLDTTKSHVDAFSRHFKEQLELYGEQTMVNLIDHDKAEGELEQHVRSVHHTANIANVHYVAFDFHMECPGLKWDKLHGLLQNLRPFLEKSSYFMHSHSRGPMSEQRGVFRTNCIDSLDRTNVVQAMLAAENLQDVLLRMGVLGDGQRLLTDLGSAKPNQGQFYEVFRNVWADHANMLSLQYSGTDALKTDFTRSGKRTVSGMLQDLYNTIIRYYKNNFADGFRQDGFDLLLGVYRVDNVNGAVDQQPKRSCYGDPAVYSRASLVLVGLLITVAMFFLSIIFAPDYDHFFVVYLAFWLFMTIAVATLFRKHASELVDFPKLRNANN